LAAAETLHGVEGLRAVGLDYRRSYCLEHQALLRTDDAKDDGGTTPRTEDESSEEEEDSSPSLQQVVSSLGEEGPATTDPTLVLHPPLLTPTVESSSPAEDDDDISSNAADSDTDTMRTTSSILGTNDETCTVTESLWEDVHPVQLKYCLNCRRKLIHTASQTTITRENRADYIADGPLYDRVVDLCQEAAQDAMCEDFDLCWETLSEADEETNEPAIRALVSSSSSDTEEPTTGTLIIVTGRGRVRAGIFSRQALWSNALEVGSAWQLLREASLRRLRVVMPDPNAKGDRYGYEVTRQSLNHLWPTKADEDVYMILHSAAGAHVQRFLLDTPGTAQTHLPRVQAIALTDSAHNQQWAREHPEWRAYWESERSLYLRSSQTMRDGSQWYLNAAGTPIRTDSFWQHRFGKVNTCWAGTDVHSLTNWYGHQPIWKHLDKYWKPRQQLLQQQRHLETRVQAQELLAR
jgi:pimeloyl-ACP methyl ester carboxylesterase